MRHPDHNFFENAGDMTFYWAHHEKFIVIDYDLAFIGGLDLCFGRWDTKQHPLADAHPAGVQIEVFPGQDFNNNRIMDRVWPDAVACRRYGSDWAMHL